MNPHPDIAHDTAPAVNTGALQSTIFNSANSANFSSSATDATGVIQIFNVGAEELGSIQADARKFKQILYNLLPNAVKFTVDGGQVTLRAGRVPRAEVGRLSGSWTGRSFPLANNELAEFLVTAKQLNAEDRAKLNGYVAAIMGKAAFDRDRFRAEVRRAMSGRLSVA